MVVGAASWIPACAGTSFGQSPRVIPLDVDAAPDFISPVEIHTPWETNVLIAHDDEPLVAIPVTSHGQEMTC